MPARPDPSERNQPWHETDYWQRDWYPEPLPDDRVVQFYDEAQVADCLVDTDPQLAAHEFLVSATELREMALESARQIIEPRRRLLAARLAATATTASLDEQAKKPVTVVVLFVRDAQTGARIPGAPSPVVQNRQFG